MTKKEMEQKISILERRIDFLLLQLKIINQEANKYAMQDNDEATISNGCISYHSKPDKIKDNLKFIEKYNESYNFYNELMNIKEYNLD